MPGLVDYTLFLWRERTDAMQIRLDWVYAIFPLFLLVAALRLGLSMARLLTTRWREEIARWNGGGADP
jgi:TRAP-type C4-dicarboxylate transport system permease small subunit